MATAYYLHRAGFRVEVIESAPTIGGRMATAPLGNRGIALGGKNIGRRYALFREFVQAMGDQPFEYFGLNSSRIRNGRIITFDGERRWAGLLRTLSTTTLRDIARLVPMVMAIKRDRRNAFLGGPFFRALARRRPAATVADHFSPAFCAEFVRPLSVRMNGAEPDEIALGSFGTNLSMVFDGYEQLRDGLDPLFEEFARTVPIRTETRAEGLIVRDGRVAGLRIQDRRGIEELAFDHVVLATPAGVSSGLVRSQAPELADLLASVRYHPVAVVVAEYNRPIFDREVRALVFPADQILSNAGVYGVEERHIVRYTFSGRNAQALLAGDPDIATLLDLGEKALAQYIPVSQMERISFTGKVMKIGLCAYPADHERFMAGVADQLRQLPGLELAGDYLRGASIEGCFQAARDCADRLCALDCNRAEPSNLGTEMALETVSMARTSAL
jgi:oxygen-dependent protoporphyrinogen oxidase